MSESIGLASARVAEHLRARILSGELPPNARIRQDEIAAELGSSRLPVREALQILRHQGLVRLRPNAGASVVPFDPLECDLIYRVRERVEPLVLEHSVPLLGADQIATMVDLQEQMEADRDLERFLELDRQFHRISYTGCPMESMLEMVDRFWDTTQHYRRTYNATLDESGWWIVDSEHRLLLAALVEGNAELASHLLEGHIRRSRIHLAHLAAVDLGH